MKKLPPLDEKANGFLADIATIVMPLVDNERALQNVAEHAVSQLADSCVIDLTGDDGSLRRAANAHAVPELCEDVRVLRLNYGSRSPSPLAPLLRDYRPLCIDQLAEIDLRALTQDDASFDAARAISATKLVAVPIVRGERCLGVIALFGSAASRPVTQTDVYLLERLAERLAVAVENARLCDSLRDAVRRKDSLLATLAHELRNPLGAMSNGLEILRLTAENESSAWAFDMLERQKQHLTRLLDDLQDASRMSRGKIVLKKRDVPLGAPLRAALETMQAQAAEKQRELSTDISCAEIVVRVDPGRLQQIVGNLLANAIQCTPAGGNIRLSAACDGEEVTIEVSDSGIGIAPGDLAGIFDRFARAKGDKHEATGGLGLGLPLARNLAELHGGSVTADSPGLGEGSRFIVRLPITQSAATEPSADRRLCESASPVDLNILAVDGNQDGVAALRRLLDRDGHTVRVVHDGRSALRAVRDQKPDLLLLDLGLPDISGEGVAARLRDDPDNASVFIVALTGHGQPDDLERTAAAGFDRHLVKPLDFAALKSIIRALQQADENRA